MLEYDMDFIIKLSWSPRILDRWVAWVFYADIKYDSSHTHDIVF